MIPYLIAFVVIAIVRFIQVFYFSRPKNYPPGPPNLPLIGSVPYMDQDFRVSLMKFREKYGKMFSFFTPDGTSIVVVSDYELLKNVLNRDEFSARPQLGPLIDLRHVDKEGEVRGVMFSNGREWQEQRRFTLKNLRDFGFGKLSMEGIIMEELEKVVKMLSKTSGQTQVLKLKMNIAILNALWYIVTGQKFDYDDPKLIGS